MKNAATVSREFWFSAAHRIEGHPKCGRLHGHNYRVTVSIRGTIAMNGMVEDFAVIDDVVKPLIEAMDHRYLISGANISAEDPYARVAKEQGHSFQLDVENSTAEEIAWMIKEHVADRMTYHPDDVSVAVQETPRNEAHA